MTLSYAAEAPAPHSALPESTERRIATCFSGAPALHMAAHPSGLFSSHLKPPPGGFVHCYCSISVVQLNDALPTQSFIRSSDLSAVDGAGETCHRNRRIAARRSVTRHPAARRGAGDEPEHGRQGLSRARA